MLIQLPSKPMNLQQFCDIVMNVMTGTPLEENDPRIELRDRMSDQSLVIREDGDKIYYKIKNKERLENGSICA